MSTKEQRIEDARRFAERWGDPAKREMMRPVALDQAARHEAANRAIFDGLMHHHLRAICSGRLELWAKAAHAAIDLIACDHVDFIKRSELP